VTAASELLCVAALAIGATSVVACNPHLYAESAAPPGRTARLGEVNGAWDVKSYTLELSSGAAIAISCSRGGPCGHIHITSDAPGIAEVRTASLDVLRPSGFYGTSQPEAAFVVVGKAAGTTVIHVRSDDGPREVVVTVVPQPAQPASAATPRTAGR
jgi:hypothetical protein